MITVDDDDDDDDDGVNCSVFVWFEFYAMIFYGLDMRSLSGSCVGAWNEIYASLYPVMQLDSASLHLAHGLRPMDKNVWNTAYVQAQHRFSAFFIRMTHGLRVYYTPPTLKRK